VKAARKQKRRKGNVVLTRCHKD